MHHWLNGGGRPCLQSENQCLIDCSWLRVQKRRVRTTSLPIPRQWCCPITVPRCLLILIVILWLMRGCRHINSLMLMAFPWIQHTCMLSACINPWCLMVFFPSILDQTFYCAGVTSGHFCPSCCLTPLGPSCDKCSLWSRPCWNLNTGQIIAVHAMTEILISVLFGLLLFI